MNNIRKIWPSYHLRFSRLFKAGYVSPELNRKGIYLVFVGPNEFGKYRLIYIGKTEDQTFKDRISQHLRTEHAEWKKKYCKIGEDIKYAVASLNVGTDDVESALIFKHQPVANTTKKEKYAGYGRVPYVFSNLNSYGFKDTNGSAETARNLMILLRKKGF